MSIQFPSIILKLVKRFEPIRQRVIMLIVWLPLLIACGGCTNLPSWLNSPFASDPIGLSIRQVQSVERPGIYTVAGSANLPDKTQVTVTAIRYLQGNGQLLTADANPFYSILDRQLAEVAQGNWETSLNLWQVAPDGKFQEAWQLNSQNFAVPLEPDPTVTFLATLDPSNQPVNFQEQVENQDEALQAALTRFTTDGELYLEANKTMTVALPTGSTTPPPAPSSNTRQSRSQATSPPSSTATPEPPATWSQTNAPLSPEAFLR
jgi:hypothetical protein